MLDVELGVASFTISFGVFIVSVVILPLIVAVKGGYSLIALGASFLLAFIAIALQPSIREFIARMF